jgi:HEAT repeat protein
VQPDSSISESGTRPTKRPRFQTGVRTLLVLIATCGILFWAARTVWESQHPVYSLARGLRARDAIDRIDAIRQLERMDTRSSGIAIPPLIVALTDGETAVRTAACQALGQLASKAVRAGVSADAARSAFTALSTSSTDREPEVRGAAVGAIATLLSTAGSSEVLDVEPAFVALTGSLRDRDETVHRLALQALGLAARGVSVSPPAALAADLKDEAVEIRIEAVKTITGFKRGLDRWIPRIFEVMEGESEPRRQTAMFNAVFLLRPPAFSNRALTSLIAALRSRSAEVRFCAAWLLGTLGPDASPAVPELIHTMSEPIDGAKVGRGKVHVMDWNPPWAAAITLGKIAPGTPAAGEVIEALLAALRSEDPNRRVAAADALSYFGPAAAAAVPALIDVIKQNMSTKADFAYGADAARALGMIAPGTPMADKALTSLVEALHADSQYTRQQAIGALLPFGQKAVVAIPRLRVLVDDRDRAVQSSAAKALTVLETKD